MKILVANWKMNGSGQIFKEYIQQINLGFSVKSVELIIAPPFPYINQIVSDINSSLDISIAGQGVSHFENGAKTGEVSVDMLSDCGARYVILGHSECRQNGAFQDALASETISRCIKNGLGVILCVGEDVGNNAANEFIIEQIISALEKVDPINSSKIIIGYEPVWAIGTGIVPAAGDIFHKRNVIDAALHSMGFGKARIIYGGSVDVDNIKSFAIEAGVDGFLVGRASMSSDNIIKMSSILDK